MSLITPAVSSEKLSVVVHNIDVAVATGAAAVHAPLALFMAALLA